jgi:Asp-tRNA(Asn)/Glu-tRNA(Gln) amidotransferase C subunit
MTFARPLLHAQSHYALLRRPSMPCNVLSPLVIWRGKKTATRKKIAAPPREGIDPDQLEQLLAEPTWAVESLLPPKTRAPDAPRITSKQLHHLLRLSALPPPETPEAEQKMLDTLDAQLHFVGKIQEVDTSGVEPLRAIRDESEAAEQEQTITVETLAGALEKEKIVGSHYKRIQRDTTPIDASDVENWDVLGSAERKAGKYFVVESERPAE